MAAVLVRNVCQITKRNVFTTATRLDLSMPDPVEHATGLEKRELLAKIAGVDNPFDMRVLKRGPGTKESPNQVPSAFDSRILGCICHEEATTIRWMWLHKEQPKRCHCGHWFKLVYKPPV